MEIKDHCIELLLSRGVNVNDIAELVFLLQKDYVQNIKIEECLESVDRVLSKREVQLAIMTGIELDILCEKKQLNDKLIEGIIDRDEGMYGVDEVLAYGICNLYGSIALTNFGYIDKLKFGIVEKLNDDPNHCNTFIDDIVGAIAASAASRFAHRKAGDILK